MPTRWTRTSGDDRVAYRPMRLSDLPDVVLFLNSAAVAGFMGSPPIMSGLSSAEWGMCVVLVVLSMIDALIKGVRLERASREPGESGAPCPFGDRA